jgi:hypothetical protein
MPFDFPEEPYDLYEETHGRARHTDPQTSHDAAESIDATPIQAVIVQILLKIGPATTHEIADSCRIGYQTITPRICNMVEKGLVYDTGITRADPGAHDRKATNRKSIVWDLCSRRNGNGSKPS